VTVAVDPFLLRSSLHAALETDSRFDACLCPVNSDPLAFAQQSHSHVLVVSEPVDAPDRCVVVLAQPGNDVAISHVSVCRNLTYAGMAAFRDELAASGRSVLTEAAS
jgi:hypothetical protein